MDDRTHIRRKSANALSNIPSTQVSDSFAPASSDTSAHHHSPSLASTSSESATTTQSQPDTQAQETPERRPAELESLPGHHFSQISVSARQIQPSANAGEEPPKAKLTSDPALQRSAIQSKKWAFSGHDFSRIRVSLQPKLTVSQPDDPYEQEADRVAEQVMHMSDLAPSTDPTMRMLQQAAQRKCAACEEDDDELMRQAESADTLANDATDQVSHVLQGGGQPLDDNARAFMEPRFGYDFSQVRVHTDAQATQSAQAVNAFAYTVGQDIVFGEGHYAPTTDAGKQLLAHELTHVVQQTQAQPSIAPKLQREADPNTSSTTTSAPPNPGTPNADTASGPPQFTSQQLIVEDTAEQIEPGQLRKIDFLGQLRPAVQTAAEEALSGDFSGMLMWPAAQAEIERQFNTYSAQDGRTLDQTIRPYAPKATQAIDYIPAICQQVRRAIAQRLSQGITGLPGGNTAPEATPATETAPTEESETTSILFKAQAGSTAKAPDDIQSVQTQLGSGHALDSDVKSKMGSAFGEDFSQVRLHTDATAAQLSQNMNARAFTVGDHVAFGAGEYQPGTLIGDALIAHELAHVVQQKGAGSDLQQKGTDDTSALETDADWSAIGVVSQLWFGATGALSNLARKAGPRLRSGLGLRRCDPNGKKSSPTPVPAPPTPAPPPSLPSDFEINGKAPDAAARPNKIFFDRSSSSIDAAEESKLTTIATAHPTTDVILRGFISEDEAASMASSRITAVDTMLGTKGHTGHRTPAPNPTAGRGQIDYRSMRVVEITRPTAASSVTDCSGGSVIPCSPASRFTTAKTQAGAKIQTAINALNSPTPKSTAALNRFFGGSSAAIATSVKTNLTNLKHHVTVQMAPENAAGPGHRCANSCDGSCAGATAYNNDVDSSALVTLCPSFMSQTDTNQRAETLIHEGAHGTTWVGAPPSSGADDFAYESQRLIQFLDPATALQNNDSYVLFIRQMNSSSTVSAGHTPPDTASGDPMTPAEREEADRAVAWLEGWLIWAEQEMGSLYESIGEAISTGSWGNAYYEGSMRLVAPRFGLTMPPSIPTMTDKTAVAALYNRYERLSNIFWTGEINFHRVSTGSTTWSAGPGQTVTLAPDFFSAPSRRAKLDLLLQKIVDAAPDISSGLKPQYVALVDEVRKHRGGGAP